MRYNAYHNTILVFHFGRKKGVLFLEMSADNSSFVTKCDKVICWEWLGRSLYIKKTVRFSFGTKIFLRRYLKKTISYNLPIVHAQTHAPSSRLLAILKRLKKKRFDIIDFSAYLWCLHSEQNWNTNSVSHLKWSCGIRFW